MGNIWADMASIAFADTVSARNFAGTNECHGWIGVKYQAHPRDEDSQILLHVRMLDTENTLQQDALGIVGVNLLYGAFFLHHKPALLVESLLDNLSTARIEIDMIEFSGIEYRHVDNRLMSLKLVQLGLTGAAVFGAGGEVLQPSAFLRKQPILVERGSFRPVTKVNIDMLECAQRRFAIDTGAEESSICELMEITMSNLMAEGDIDLQDFLARAKLIAAAGKTVLISDYFEYYRLCAYLARYTTEPIAVTMGAGSVVELFTERYYQELEGGILEVFGKMFTTDFRIYVYPLRKNGNGRLLRVENIEMPPELEKLYGHFVDRGLVLQLDNFDDGVLDIFSRDVLKRIAAGDVSWESMVPEEIAEVIKQRRFFSYTA